MKNSCIFLLLLTFAKISRGQQLSVSGKITGAGKRDRVEINVSFDGYYWKNGSIFIRPDKAGNFHALLPYRSAKFALLKYKERSQFILLDVNRPIHIKINARRQIFSFSGPAKMENELLQRLHLEEADSLSFMKEARRKDIKTFASWSVDSVIRIKFPAIKHSLDSAQKLVSSSVIPLKLKSMIADELKFYYAAAIADNLGARRLYNKKNYASFNTHFIDTVLTYFGLPTKQQLDVSTSANYYLQYFFSFKLWQSIYFFKTDPDKDHADSIFEANTGASWRALLKDPDIANEKYTFAIHLSKILPAYAWQKHLANLLTTFCMSSQLMAADKLLNFIMVNCRKTLTCRFAKKPSHR